MLVYCAICKLNPTDGVEQVLDTITEWLSMALERSFTTAKMRAAKTSRFRDGVLVDFIEKQSGYPRLYAVRHTVPDLASPSRQWITEIGLRQAQEKSDVFCSVVSRLDEQSPFVSKPILPTRPDVLDGLLEKCNPVSGTPGLVPLHLDSTTLDSITELILDEKRLHPLILLPKQQSKAAIHPERLRQQLVGVADVCTFDPDCLQTLNKDTSPLHALLSPKEATFLYPFRLRQTDSLESNMARVPLQTQHQRETRYCTEDELVARLLHHANRQCALRHTSLDTIKTSLFRHEFTQRINQMKALEANTQETKEYAALFEEADRELTTKERQVIKLQHDLENVVDENRQLQSKYDNMRLIVENKSGPSNTTDSYAPEFCQAFESLFAEGPTLEQSLVLLSTIYPDRIVILDTAMASAKKSQRFKYRQKAFDLLRTLVTDYYQVLQSKGDAEARKVFGNAYSARESKTVESNPRSRELHTFHYKGVPMVMLKHLKIGVKDSIYETVRIYFEWDPQDSKIIIGHCGPHLEHPC